MRRPCLDCGRPSTGSRCPTCQSAAHQHRDQRRGSANQRGYDADYEKQKRDPAYRSATHCQTCGAAFTKANPKTAGHTTDLRHGGQGSPIFPQCQRCNYGWRRTNR